MIHIHPSCNNSFPRVHYTQRNDPLQLSVKYCSQNVNDPETIRLFVDTEPSINGQIVVTFPKRIILNKNDSSWTSFKMQPQQLSYHSGCDFKIKLFAFDPTTEQVVHSISPFLSTPITLKSKRTKRRKIEHKSPDDMTSSQKTDLVKKEKLRMWIDASVEYMKMESTKGEDEELVETPIQQYLINQFKQIA